MREHKEIDVGIGIKEKVVSISASAEAPPLKTNNVYYFECFVFKGLLRWIPS